jgi:hypothetical protein
LKSHFLNLGLRAGTKNVFSGSAKIDLFLFIFYKYFQMIYKDAESKINNSRKNDLEEKNLINGEGISLPKSYGWNFENKN